MRLKVKKKECQMNEKEELHVVNAIFAMWARLVDLLLQELKNIR